MCERGRKREREREVQGKEKNRRGDVEQQMNAGTVEHLDRTDLSLCTGSTSGDIWLISCENSGLLRHRGGGGGGGGGEAGG